MFVELSNEIFYFNTDIRSVADGCSRHYHNLFEIYYMKEGNCSYFIDNKVYEITSGDIVLIPDGVIHKTNYDDKPHTRLLINFSANYIPTSIMSQIPKLIYLYRNEKALPEIDEIFTKIEAEYNSPDEFTNESVKCLVHSLFFIMARNNNSFSNKSSSSILIEECVKYIKKNFMHALSLSDMAKLYSVSPEHLSRIFKKETGFGFNEFITLVRLQRAEAMLKNENGKTISEIAYACGFNDSNYFSDKFKKAYGTVPSEVKKKFLK
jgi:AraC-like DNA-binding protein